VNTRLQVEHPVSEETTGIDLVREQFRIADGEPLRFTGDPAPRGHSFEFRINGEDPGRGFLPAPGAVTKWAPPSGPGVRVDTGIEAGSVIGGNFDSLLAKLIVTGESRVEALARARRALDEMVVDGMATALPFHRAIVRDEAFTAEPFTVHTRWIETEFENTIEPFAGAAPAGGEAEERTTVVVEVGGKRLSVSLPASFGRNAGTAASGGTSTRRPAGRKSSGGTRGGAAGGDSLVSPMQGTIVKLVVSEGDEVAEGDPVVILEAMKMEQPLAAHKAGVVTGLSAAVGEVITAGAVICEIK
jgi:acetyl-CoA/propionyl-CoA carboxylase biotin carboxyl carrier protein